MALTKLAKSLPVENIAGRIIILPMANFPAAKAGERVSPIDGGNLNRTFPGTARGTATEQIAFYIESELFTRADYFLDLHSGGTSLEYLPTVLLDWSQPPEIREQQIRLAEVFAAPYGCFFPGGHGGTSSSAAAARHGAIGLTTELGGAGTVSRGTLRIGERGVVNFLSHIEVLKDHKVTKPDSELRIVWATAPETFLFADEAGLFEPAVDLGSPVEKGDVAGWLHHPESPWREAETVRFQIDGMVLCKRVPGRAERGDCLFHLCRPQAD